jgi:hypothetical protein
MPCSITEIDLVASIQPQTERTRKPFHAQPRIKRWPRVSGRHAIEGTSKSRRRILVGNAKVHKADLPGYEHAQWSASQIIFRTKQGTKIAKSRIHQLRVHAIAESAGEIALEVIIHLPFELPVRAEIECGSAAQPDKFDIRSGALQAKLVGENSSFEMISFDGLRKQRRRSKKAAGK